MDILAENNSFQNMGACITKQANSPDEVDDFIQLCIQLIFYGSISISGMVPDDIFQKSSETIHSLEKIFKDNIKDDIKNIFHQLNCQETNIDYNEVKNAIASELLRKIQKENLLEQNKAGATLAILPSMNTELLNQFSIFTKVVNTGNIELIKKTFHQQLIENKNDASFYDIVDREEAIIDEIYIFSQKYGGWNDAMGYKLVSDLRVLTNQLLSFKTKNIYSPSVKRGKNIMKEREKLPKIIADVLNEYNNTSFKNSRIFIPKATLIKYPKR